MGLLKQLMGLQSLNDFFLVGGTALALQYGHRLSVDLDLFTQNTFDTAALIEALQQHFTFQVLAQKEESSLALLLMPPNTEAVKVDFIRYKYPQLKPLVIEERIRLLAPEDIIPMKLSAMANRGQKKDFYDIYELLKHFTLAQMLELFSQKYPGFAHFHIVKSLTYFQDAEEDFDPISLNGTTWETVKSALKEKVKGGV